MGQGMGRGGMGRGGAGAGQGMAGQGAGQGMAGQGDTGAWQGRGQGRAGQGRAGQGRAGQGRKYAPEINPFPPNPLKPLGTQRGQLFTRNLLNLLGFAEGLTPPGGRGYVGPWREK